MVFSSLLFLFRFLPLMLAVYFIAPRRLRNGILFLGSLIFYGWGEPVYISLLLFSTLVDYMHGRMIGYFKSHGNKQAAKWMVGSSAVVNLGLLGFFKYSSFLATSLNQIPGIQLPIWNITLPIGISFYTFQTMSYTIDVYRGETEVQKDIISFGAYVSMFPQLIAGPIVRYSTIARELNDRRETTGQFAEGIRRFSLGLGKKVLLANQIGMIWDEIGGIASGQRTILMLWLGVAAYGLQLYYDFSGYSDMAIGMGHMLGFHFPENFNYPYMAHSITDFWRRWHMTLGTWFKEYVYIPLGGNRKGKFHQVINILAVWTLTGIWHGAGWNFLLWGLYFGVLLLLEKLLFRKWLEQLPGFLQIIYTVVLVFAGWVLFSHDNLAAGVSYYSAMAGLTGLPFANARTWYLLVTNIPLMGMGILGATSGPAALGRWFQGRKIGGLAELLWIYGILLLCTAYLVNASYNPFLYFRF